MIGTKHMSYQFAILDPRPTPAAKEANDKIFALGPVLGIEVTIPGLAQRCTLGNIDPQHSGAGSTNLAAIDVAVTCDLPPDGTVLATVRADLDSIGAMAVIAIRREIGGADLNRSFIRRVSEVSAADRFSQGRWAPSRPLGRDNWWPSTGSAGDLRDLAAIAAAVADHKISLEQRIEWMREWLASEQEPDGYRARVDAERGELVAAIERGEIPVELVADGRIAVVRSTHRAALAMGYAMAPVVIAVNPEFSFFGGAPHLKYTISAWSRDYADIAAATKALTVLEPGWGGSPTIAGSPQGVSSMLTVDQVVSAVSLSLAQPANMNETIAALEAAHKKNVRYPGLALLYYMAGEAIPELPDCILPVGVPLALVEKAGIHSWGKELLVPDGHKISGSRYQCLQYSPGLRAAIRALGGDPVSVHRGNCNIDECPPLDVGIPAPRGAR